VGHFAAAHFVSYWPIATHMALKPNVGFQSSAEVGSKTALVV
jgi:hypothetical protein